MLNKPSKIAKDFENLAQALRLCLNFTSSGHANFTNSFCLNSSQSHLLPRWTIFWNCQSFLAKSFALFRLTAFTLFFLGGGSQIWKAAFRVKSNTGRRVSSEIHVSQPFRCNVATYYCCCFVVVVGAVVVSCCIRSKREREIEKNPNFSRWKKLLFGSKTFLSKLTNSEL